MQKRRAIVHPVPPALTEIVLIKNYMDAEIPAFHAMIQVYLQGLPRYRSIYFQTYTFGQYDTGNSVRGSKNGWCWHASCRCGVNYDGDALYVKKRMRAHTKVHGHEPGSLYTIPGQESYLAAKRQKNRSTHASKRSIRSS